MEFSLVSFVLNPICKLDVLIEMLTMYYDELIPVKGYSSLHPSLIVSQLRNCSYEIYKEYNSKYGVQENESGSQNTKNGTSSSLKLTKA